MRTLVLAGLTCTALLVGMPETAYAHGGQYRGPGDVVPPNPGGGRGNTPGPSGPSTPGPSGPSTPGPAGPATPGPAGPSTGGPAGPGAARGPTTGGRGIQLDDDLTRWEFWWEFNKDPFIRLKEAIHTGGVQTGSDDFFMGAGRRVEAKDSLKPTDEDILNNILPALKRAMDTTDNRDINSSCMVAMAKIGKDHPDFKLLDVFKSKLSSRDQEISETAALSIGIAQIADDEPVEMLIALAKDEPKGREVCGRSEVNDRTRSFATYGLGQVAYATSNVDVKRRIFDALAELLKDDQNNSRNLQVAVVNAIGLINPDPYSSDEKEKQLLADCLQALEDYYMKPLGSGEQILQSHCPPAIAKLIPRDHEKAAYYKELFAADLQRKGKVKRSSPDIDRSCALALGQLCLPYEDSKSEDAKYSRLLLDYYNKGKDQQARYFSLLALGQIGGNENRNNLLKAFDKGKKALEKPWAAMALGVYAYKKYEAAKAAGRTAPIEDAIGNTLKAGLEIKNPSTQSAVAVALGLVKYGEAADALRSLLIRNSHQDELAGYICIGLALMNDQRSVEDIREIVTKSIRRPDLLKQAAIALGKLGDKSVAELLQQMMTQGEPNLAKLSAIASALGFIGDRRTIEPLKQMLFNEDITELARAFAAVALGGVADKEPVPWNSKVSTNMNYRAAVETLTDRTSGILDIL